MAVAQSEIVAQGLILHVRNVGEGHQMVDAWLTGHGRTALWARGARASKRRFGGALSPFADVEFTIVPSPNVWTLRKAHLTQDRFGIRNSLAAIGRAATLSRVVMALWPQNQDAPEVREGLTVALDHLAQGRLARAAGLYPRLAVWCGLMPDLTLCGQCHRVAPGQLGAAAQLVDLRCTTCMPTVSILDHAVLGALAGARITSEAVADRVEEVVTLWAGLHAERKLAPWRMPPLPAGPASA